MYIFYSPMPVKTDRNKIASLFPESLKTDGSSI